MKKQLQRIYKANQCVDLFDVDNAINQVLELLKDYPMKHALLIRLGSLANRKEKILIKSNKQQSNKKNAWQH